MRGAVLCFLAFVALTVSGSGQVAAVQIAETQVADPNMDVSTKSHSDHDMQTMPGMNMAENTGQPSAIPSWHAGSGTAWQPASVPAHLWMTSRGNWDLMAHGAIFITYNQQGGPRGAGKAERDRRV